MIYDEYLFFIRSDFTEALYAYRQAQQTLAGLSLSQIEEGVLNIVRNKYPSKQVNKTLKFDFFMRYFFCRWILTPLELK
jgi:hypothetical protein